jgi:hypothetical protein
MGSSSLEIGSRCTYGFLGSLRLYSILFGSNRPLSYLDHHGSGVIPRVATFVHLQYLAAPNSQKALLVT